MQKEFNQQRIEMGERIRKLRKRCDFCQESLAEDVYKRQVNIVVSCI